MKSLMSSVVEVLAAGSVTVGAAMWSPAAGFVVGGGFGLLFARSVSR